MASGSVSGQTSIGDLSTVTIAGTATVNIASATLAFQGDTSSSTKLHITSATQSVNVSGTLDGSVALSAALSAEIPPLPELEWSGTFKDDISGSSFGTPQYQLQEPTAGSILSDLGSQLSSALADFSPLGSLEPQLDEPLPLINESIAQITGLDNQLPEFPTLASLDLDPSNAISALESLGIEINDGNTSPAALATMVDNLLHGQEVDLLSWSNSGDVQLASDNVTIPIYDLGLPGIISADLDATFGASASLSYQLGFGLDTCGLWIQAGSGIGLNFNLEAGIQGELEVLGSPLVQAGGTIGFDISPSTSLSQDPYSSVVGRVYATDLYTFGPDLAQDYQDALNDAIQGSITGTVYASINLGVVSGSTSYTIDIPVFNLTHNAIWPGASSSASSTPESWPQLTDSANGIVTFSDTTPGSNNDDVALSEGPNGSLTVTWKGHKALLGDQGANGPDSETIPDPNIPGLSQAVTSFDFDAGGGQDTLTTGQGFDIPIVAIASPNQSNPVYFDGGDASSTLIGGGGNDTLVGGGGADFIQAGTGNDLIVGGQEGSTLIGGSGIDSIYGGPGSDVIYGGSGLFYIDGGGGNDTIYGGQGHAETVNGVLTYPVIHGGDGHVLIIDMSAATANLDHYPTGGPVAGAFSGFGIDPFNSSITIGPTQDDANTHRDLRRWRQRHDLWRLGRRSDRGRLGSERDLWRRRQRLDQGRVRRRHALRRRRATT